jgi:hypothetical protein
MQQLKILVGQDITMEQLLGLTKAIQAITGHETEVLQLIMKILMFSLLLFIVLLGGNVIHAQSEVCSLTTYFWDEPSKSSSSRFLVGKFPLEFEDGSVSKAFRHQESGKDVYVGVEQIAGISKSDPKRIRIAVSLQARPDVFDDVDRAEAETIYDRTWRWLSVSKSIRIGTRTYTFTFGCEREKSGR